MKGDDFILIVKQRSMRGPGRREEALEQRWSTGLCDPGAPCSGGVSSAWPAGCRRSALTHPHSTASSGSIFRNCCVEQFLEMLQFRNTSALIRLLFPLSLHSSFPLLTPSALFFFPMNEKKPLQNISLDIDLTLCAAREGQVQAKGHASSATTGDKVVAAIWVNPQGGNWRTA